MLRAPNIEELILRHQAMVRAVIRAQLTRDLRRHLDTNDITQCVMVKLWKKLIAGKCDGWNSAHLRALLKRMANDEIIDRTRHYAASRRDLRRAVAVVDEQRLTDFRQLTPSTIAMTREIAATLETEVRRRLTRSERELARMRGESYSWPEIAERMRKDQDALRHQLNKAFGRVAEQLGRLWEADISTQMLLNAWICAKEVLSKKVS